MPRGKSYNIDWNEIFRYDESSPSGLCWNKDVYGGSSGKSLLKRKGEPAGSRMSKGGHWAVAIRVNGKRVRLLVHRVIWEMFNGEIPPSYVIDHIDRDGSNNSISNLRCVPEVYNLRNVGKKSSNKTGVTGVTLSKDRHGYYYYVASWTELDGRSRSKHFSINKYGEDQAFALAVRARKEKIEELNKQGAGYTETHGD